jgi:hypothetical protein
MFPSPVMFSLGGLITIGTVVIAGTRMTDTLLPKKQEN